MNSKKSAQAMRLKGKTYTEISRRLGVPKSTLSGWFRDLNIPGDVEKSLMSKRQSSWRKTITKFNQERGKKIRKHHQDQQNQFSEEIDNISLKELKLIGSALYWAEGYKKTRHVVIFCNSDPNMIKLMIRFFREVCLVDSEKLWLQVQIHKNVSKLKAIRFWSRIAGVPVKNFKKSFYQTNRASKGKRSLNTLPYGVCRVIIHDVSLVDKILGWISGLANQI